MLYINLQKNISITWLQFTNIDRIVTFGTSVS